MGDNFFTGGDIPSDSVYGADAPLTQAEEAAAFPGTADYTEETSQTPEVTEPDEPDEPDEPNVWEGVTAQPSADTIVTPESTTGTDRDPGTDADGNKVTLPTIDSTKALADHKEIYGGLAAGFADTAANQEAINYVKPDASSLKGKAGGDYVGDNSLVSSQLTRLIDADSDYIKQAEERAKIQSQASGLLSSSMAAGAARGAAIERALPIAQQDADTYAKHQLQQQQGDINQFQSQVEGLVSGALADQRYGLIDRNAAMTKGFDAVIAGAEGEDAIVLNQLKADTEFIGLDALKRLDYYFQKDINDDAADQRMKEVASTQAGAALHDWQVSINNINTNPEILQLGSEVRNLLITGENNTLRSAMSVIQATTNQPMTQATADVLNNLS